MLNKFIIVFSIIVLMTLGVIWKLEQEINQSLVIEDAEFIVIEKGETVNRLAKDLITKGWIKNDFWLKVFVKINADLTSLKAGTYQVLPPVSLRELLVLLNSGKEHQFSITFIEGTTLKEWRSQLGQHPHIVQTIQATTDSEIATSLGINDKNPEGWFFPDTYAFTANTSDISLLKRAYSKMKTTLAEQWDNRDAALPYGSPYEALIMASIVEKESGQEIEKPIIASVFVNRLHKKMRLQTDPTVIYGLGDRFKGDITRKHLREKTAYNTYRINRLPPTPISMPGLSTLKAVMNPEYTDYLYFVSKGNGFHIFSSNLADHNAAVARYQLGKK